MVYQKKYNKENTIPTTVNRNKASTKEKHFYLIVEIDRQPGHHTPPGVSQYWYISSKNILDVPVISSKTVYTGKKLKINNNEGKAVSGTCVLFSADQKFVQDQFAQITVTNTASMESPMNPPPTNVLNVSQKGNVMTNGNGTTTTTTTASGRKVKLPNSITVKSITTNGTKDHHQQENLEVEYVTPDGQVLSTGGRPMMYDQQSQTDPAMYEGVVPATAAQSHQQAQQIAQLIRANNGLVVEVRNLKGSTHEMRQMIVDMDAKLAKALEILSDRGDSHSSVAYAKEEVDEEPNSSAVEYSIINENSMDQSISFADSVKSENTPPLKKNKQKLRNSLQEALTLVNTNNARTAKAAKKEEPQQLALGVEYVMIGKNGTQVPKEIVDNMNYSNHSTVTRKILTCVFDRETLATHSLTGKPSPAFSDRDAKMQLDPLKTQDIVEFIKESCNVSDSQIRGVITSKLADENKMHRMGMKKRGHSLDASTVTLLNGSMGGSGSGTGILKKRKMDKENFRQDYE